MKFILATLLTASLSFMAGLYLPWWSIAPVAFGVALLMHQSIGRSFLAGFLGIFLLWLVVAWWRNYKNESFLSIKVAQLFGVGSPLLLILITALIGALVGGFAAISGSSLYPAKIKRRY